MYTYACNKCVTCLDALASIAKKHAGWERACLKRRCHGMRETQSGVAVAVGTQPPGSSG